MNELHLINIYSISSVIIAGLVIGRLFLTRSRIPHDYINFLLYDVTLLNIAFMVILLFSHGVGADDGDDTILWFEAAIMNILFIGSIYLGQRKWRG